MTFEPTPHSYELLCKNLATNHIDNAQAFQEAVWSEQGTLFMDTTTRDPGQFISHASKPDSAVRAIAVSSIRLEEAFERLGLIQCDLLKMDCEGAEYAILFNSSTETLEKINHIIMEYHDNVTEFTHLDLEKYLLTKGFTVQTQENYVHGYLGYLYALRN